MEQQININWHISNSDSTIKKGHFEELKKSVMRRINQMMNDGYIEGELLEYIRMDDEDGEDGIEYQGYWTAKTESSVNGVPVVL